MNRIARFAKVSEKIFVDAASEVIDINDSRREPVESIYNDIMLPKRATSGSAGYDFFSPLDVTLKPGESIKIPTGIRAQMDSDWVLLIMPRSSLGFKFRMQLSNTVGVIDSDYYFSDNEGHIIIKIVNANNEGKDLHIEKGKAFAQGIFMPYGITVDDDTEAERNGGFGSTDKAH